MSLKHTISDPVAGLSLNNVSAATTSATISNCITSNNTGGSFGGNVYQSTTPFVQNPPMAQLGGFQTNFQSWPDPAADIVRMQAMFDQLMQRMDAMEADLSTTLIELKYYKKKCELLERFGAAV